MLFQGHVEENKGVQSNPLNCSLREKFSEKLYCLPCLYKLLSSQNVRKLCNLSKYFKTLMLLLSEKSIMHKFAFFSSDPFKCMQVLRFLYQLSCICLWAVQLLTSKQYNNGYKNSQPKNKTRKQILFDVWNCVN